ncbi:uncharacterized protein KQ657_002905 [Scheffersomyces spartinae]|uniref:Uncharacterized protein n=1 Tax=Scheffersomyces spartinae TaxID=45513 RepID=A0A9P8AGI5_9ASCO|nr:uncharacterized protein KQ657_002905 [Scheffersomyces spartinae]KAG7191636.1 hypothetical protein KQ657_002905 [Scheffersomyces spartinae]
MSQEKISMLGDAQLRYVLIGNNDMKYTLLSDREFMEAFGRRFAANCAHQDWAALHDQAIVLRLLSTFHDMNEEALDVFEGIVQLIVVQLDMSINGEDNSAKTTTTPLVEETIQYFLESLIHLSNRRFFKYDGEKLWMFVIQMLYQRRSLTLLNLLIRITPILLKCFKLAHHKRLLFILFALLHSGCSEIVDLVLSHYGVSHFDETEVLEDLRLPNFDIPPHFFKENTGFSLLIPLLTSFLQIYNYMADNNLEFVPDDDFESGFGTVYITCLLFLKSSSTSSSFAPSDSKLVAVLSLNFICMYIEQVYKLRSSSIAAAVVEGPAVDEEALHSMVSRNFLKILYKIDECFDYNPDILYIHSPVKLLAHVCDLFPSVGNNYIRNTTLDSKVRLTMKDQLLKNGWLFEFWHNSKDFTSVLDFAALDLMGSPNRNSISNSAAALGSVSCSSVASSTSLISDLFHLLSIYTSSEEDHRQRIIKDVSELPLILFQVMETYRYLLLQLQVNFRELKLNCLTSEQRIWLSKNVGIVMYLLDLPVFTNCLYFMRSLSRSVTALRTLFVECNGYASVLCGDRLPKDDITSSKDLKKLTANKGRLIYNILQIVNGIECGTKFIRGLTGQTSQVQLTNKLVLLALISNLILDFLSFRLEIVNNSNFVLNLLKIYKSAESGASNELEVEAALVIQYHVSWVLKNLLYNENSESKRRVVQVFPLLVIFKNCAFNDINSKHFEIELNKKLVSFEILQNLTSGSPEFIRDITLSFAEFATTETVLREDGKPIKLWDEFVIWNISNYKLFTKSKSDDSNKMLLKILENNKYAEMVCSIFYIENHKYVGLRLSSSKDVSKYESTLPGGDTSQINNNEDDPMDGYVENMFPLLSFLSIWLFFLQFDIPTDYPQFTKVVNNLTDINLAITWNLVNLTKKPNDSLDRRLGVGAFRNVKPEPEGNSHSLEELDKDEELDDVTDYDTYFELYDTVDTGNLNGSGPHNLIGSASLPLGMDSWVNAISIDHTEDIDLLKAEGRAAYLKGVGFTAALQGILLSKSVIQQSRQAAPKTQTHKGLDVFAAAVTAASASPSAGTGIGIGGARVRTSTNGELKPLTPRSGFRRFEAVHSDDLVDKVRLANRQIFELLMNNKSVGNNVRPEQKQREDNNNNINNDNSRNAADRHNGPRATLIPIAAVSPLRDIMYGIQRGGEGFGYGLDEEYMTDEAVVMSEDEQTHDEMR